MLLFLINLYTGRMLTFAIEHPTLHKDLTNRMTETVNDLMELLDPYAKYANPNIPSMPSEVFSATTPATVKSTPKGLPLSFDTVTTCYEISKKSPTASGRLGVVIGGNIWAALYKDLRRKLMENGGKMGGTTASSQFLTPSMLQNVPPYVGGSPATRE